MCWGHKRTGSLPSLPVLLRQALPEPEVCVFNGRLKASKPGIFLDPSEPGLEACALPLSHPSPKTNKSSV